jgi:5-methyltetrahydrofolate--homocysteine methyltransferase
MSDLNLLTEAVIKGDRNAANALTRKLIEAGEAPQAILDALTGAMDEIGRRFQANEVFVPEMLIAARAMKEAMAHLEPRLTAAGIRPKFTAVIGTVQGDLHDIGKNLVAMMWKGANFAVVDLGTNVPAEKFVAAAREHGAAVIGLSSLLTTTMPAMKDTVAAIRAAGLDGPKVLVGGAPITQAFAEQIGADGYAPDAAGAVQAVRDLVGA